MKSKKCEVCGRKVSGVCGYEFDHYMIKNNVTSVDEAILKAIHPTMMMFDLHATRIRLGISKDTSDAIQRVRESIGYRISNKGK